MTSNTTGAILVQFQVCMLDTASQTLPPRFGKQHQQERNHMYCKYCGKKIDGEPYPHRGNNFHDSQEAELYQHLETFVIPNYPTEKGKLYPAKQPFVEEL